MESNEYYVISFPDKYSIIISAGKNNSNLTVGDEVKIYEAGEEVIDLDGQVLGKYEFVKDVLEVINVSEYYSVCQKFSTTTESPMTKAFMPFFEQKVTKTNKALSINPEQIDNWGQKSDYINKGDFVSLN